MDKATRVKTIIAEQFGGSPETITEDKRFMEDMDCDSLDTWELVIAIEEEFGIEIPDEDANNISTVGELIKYVEKKT